jgi:hypothetical protein
MKCINAAFEYAYFYFYGFATKAISLRAVTG